MSNDQSNHIDVLYIHKNMHSPLQTIMGEYRIIDQYLNLDCHFLHEYTQPIVQKHQCPTICEVRSASTLISSPVRQQKTRSVFHNFLKHLISLLKKFIYLRKDKLAGKAQGELAYALWACFIDNSSSNKKLLNLIFGTAQISKIPLQVKGLPHHFHNFRHVFSKYSYSQICEAQALLREKVTTQAKTLSKQFLRSNSNVGRFEEFYLYFTAFIGELAEGPISRRMKKTTKKQLGLTAHDDVHQ